MVRESALWEIHHSLSQSWKERQVDEKENLYPTWRGRGPSYLLTSGQDGAQRWRAFPPGAAVSPGAQAEQKQHPRKCGPPGVAQQPSPSPALSHGGGKMEGRAGGVEDRVSRVGGSRELVLGRIRGCQGGCLQINPAPPSPYPAYPAVESGGTHLRGGGPHQEPEEGMGWGHHAGFSILCSYRHHHHGVGGGCVWYLQPQAPPGGLVLFQVNPGEWMPTSGFSHRLE